MKIFPRMIFLSVALVTFSVTLLVSDCISQSDIGSSYSNSLAVDSQNPPPRIVYFKAEPSVIKEGGIAFLKWKVENAKSVSISGIGVVTPTDMGKVSVRPEGWTNYKLTATNDFIHFVEESAKIAVIKRIQKARSPKP